MKMTAIACCLSVLLVVPAFANPPQDGTYKSTDLGGSILLGRYSETWVGAKLSVGNTVNQESWDGTTLATQWRWYCAYIASPPTLILDTVVGGTGQKVWQVTYTNGMVWLDGNGPWGDGSEPSYTATIQDFEATVTEQYSGGLEVSTVKTVNATAQFMGYSDNCIVLALSNMAKYADGQTLPADYPDFLDGSTCTSLGTTGPGEWGDVDEITYSLLGCTVPTQQKSWGAIKQMYRK